MKIIPVIILLIVFTLNGFPGTETMVLCFGRDGHVGIHGLTLDEKESCCDHSDCGPSHGHSGEQADDDWDECPFHCCDCTHTTVPGANHLILPSGYVYILSMKNTADHGNGSAPLTLPTRWIEKGKHTLRLFGTAVFLQCLGTIVLLI